MAEPVRARRWNRVPFVLAAALVTAFVVLFVVVALHDGGAGGSRAHGPGRAAARHPAGVAAPSTTTTGGAGGTTTTTPAAVTPAAGGPGTTSTTPGPVPAGAVGSTTSSSIPVQDAVSVHEDPGSCTSTADGDLADTGTLTNHSSDDASVEVDVKWKDQSGAVADTDWDVFQISPGKSARWSLSGVWDTPNGPVHCEVTIQPW